MKFKLFSAATTIILTLILAQLTPNIIGTWASITKVLVIGRGLHHHAPNKKDGEIYFNHVSLKLTTGRQNSVTLPIGISSINYKKV